MSADIVEQLVLEKAQLRNQAQQLLGLLAAVALQDGTDTKKGRQYRIPKVNLNRLNHSIDIHTQKSGSVVITISENKE